MLGPNSFENRRFETRPFLKRWTWPWIVVVVASTLFSLLAGAVCLWGLPYFDFDLTVSRAVQELPATGTTDAMHLLSLAGDNAIAASLLVVLAAVVLFLLKARREALVLIGAVLVSQVLKISIKNLIGRPRPRPENVNVLFSAQEIYSFPSGHTVHYTVFFGFLLFASFMLVRPLFLRRSLCVLFGGLVVFIGLARIYLGAHWISDVIGGYLLGGAVLAAGLGVYRQRRSPPSVALADDEFPQEETHEHA